MSKRAIIKLPDPLLRRVSKPIERIDSDVNQLVDDLLETMYAAPGVGLAAIQVGVDRRVFVLDVAEKETEPEPRAFINPEILSLGDEVAEYEEGCLSIPGVRLDITRPTTAQVRYLNREGKLIEEEVSGLLATAIQHELDHLNGRLIIDYASRLKRDVIIRRFKKMAKDEAEEG